jgi:hypothetical protein
MNRRCLVWLVCAACFAEMSAACQGKGGDIVLLKADGKQLRVPSGGGPANAAAQEIAREIAAFDKRASSRPSRGRPDVGEAVRRLSEEVRDDTVDQLDMHYRLPDQVSGSFDTALLEAARKSADMLKQVMGSPPPPSLNVHTEITTSIPNAVLHDCLRGDYKRNACSWRSYSAGALMPIGLYVFRAENATGEGRAVEEEILVLHDPTKQPILPMR